MKEKQNLLNHENAFTVLNITMMAHARKRSKWTAKKEETVYKKYSGYQGGLKIENLEMLAARRGYSEGLKRAIKGMIPNNKLRPELMKRLTISE